MSAGGELVALRLQLVEFGRRDRELGERGCLLGGVEGAILVVILQLALGIGERGARAWMSAAESLAPNLSPVSILAFASAIAARARSSFPANAPCGTATAVKAKAAKPPKSLLRIITSTDSGGRTTRQSGGGSLNPPKALNRHACWTSRAR
jgi:hypothetical protein